MTSTASPPSSAIAASSTRKRAAETDTILPTKKKSKREKVSSQKQDARPTEVKKAETTSLDDSFAHMDAALLSDHVARKAKYFERKLTDLELEDKFIPEAAWHDTSSWDPRRDLDHLGDYLEHFCPARGKKSGLAWAPNAQGAPHTLMITGAALRAADLSRVLRRFKTKDASVAKLFAKHIKFKEAEQLVRSSRIGIAVGTPTRVLDLIQAGALSTEHLQRVILDASYQDAKQRNMFDMRETFLPLMTLLNLSGLRGRYVDASSKLDLLVY
ncbi:MAG: hypothetical protein M1823_002820 [Watsoniomyces obsoletus]|nr:MAG: hypothetical protein M1823_002820 [Watsoniomyces obsoletus]